MVGAAGAAPSLAVPVWYANWLSRYERPTAGGQLLLLAWGGACAAVLARAVNNRVGGEVGVLVAAPVVEETLKAAPLLAVLALCRWTGARTPGAVGLVARGVLVAAGFAAVENVFVIADEHAYGTGEVVRLALVRTALGPLTHPLFTGLAAVGLALAYTARHRHLRVLAPVGGLAAAIGVHAVWNVVTGRFETATTVLFVAMAVLLAILLTFLTAAREQSATPSLNPD